MEVIKDYADLTQASLDKLHKLQDVSEQYRSTVYREYLDADARVKAIQLEIASRLIEND